MFASVILFLSEVDIWFRVGHGTLYIVTARNNYESCSYFSPGSMRVLRDEQDSKVSAHKCGWSSN